ncbi:MULTISPECIES: LxmA leader domain family RiPP [unclassified Streptomyces]|uniref:LxmA leader domain family RiPP n=1 Tax=unclassified Streptomyces TaxID=2593676 RepID=UPI002ED37F39|nr:LxmA leader domain family RiPP [Streptomyces sp. NBC_00891]WSY07180.1 LxmA leader domain family RiPP [Streptomyces sp. NBC_00890]WSZ08807.1 LxmA leader domain family RiPP [Streptomyces sp. NBC_00869]WSZ23695.1 LxmA leader domain family RiPP [Streptomyces sp. NBC_00870]
MQNEQQGIDELLAGYSTYTDSEELVAAGAAQPIIATITMTQTETTIFTPESPVTTLPCYLA